MVTQEEFFLGFLLCNDSLSPIFLLSFCLFICRDFFLYILDINHYYLHEKKGGEVSELVSILI